MQKEFEALPNNQCPEVSQILNYFIHFYPFTFEKIVFILFLKISKHQIIIFNFNSLS